MTDTKEATERQHRLRAGMQLHSEAHDDLLERLQNLERELDRLADELASLRAEVAS